MEEESKPPAVAASDSAVELQADNSKESQSPSVSTTEQDAAKRRKQLFGDCALIEIIHLHDCLRGALKALETDVEKLSQSIVKSEGPQSDHLEDLERRVAGRFKVIWSVFRAHSSAEDEFIWPALQRKTQGRIQHHSPKYKPDGCGGSCNSKQQQQEEEEDSGVPAIAAMLSEDVEVIVQEEYEEDHADEERRFDTIDNLLGKLRNLLIEQKGQATTGAGESASESASEDYKKINDTAQELSQHTKSLSEHLHKHLEKEENQCMPLVSKHLSRSEIHDLVGNIMGKRSSDLIAQIMTMAVQNLTYDEREEMIKYMKQAMEGTFFDRWLLMSGWGQSSTDKETHGQPSGNTDGSEAPPTPSDALASGDGSKKRPAEGGSQQGEQDKRPNLGGNSPEYAQVLSMTNSDGQQQTHITGQAELERLIRAVASNPALTAAQKNTTIQGLRDSVWKSNLRHKEQTEQLRTHAFAPQANNGALSLGSTAVSAAGIKTRRTTPPSVYLKKNDQGKVEFVWSG